MAACPTGAITHEKMDMDNFVLWGKSMDEPCLASTLPHDGNDATHGNGTMVALRMDSTEAVDAFYAKAMDLGAEDEGPATHDMPNIRMG